MKTIDDIVAEIIKAEGSTYTEDKSDSGGPTRYGITLKTLSDYRGNSCTAVDVMNLTEKEAKQIYLNRYYIEPKFNLLMPISAEITSEVVDAGVNIGQGNACRILQRSLNAFNQQAELYPDLIVDGNCGQRTADALKKFIEKRKKEGERVLMVLLNCLQGAYYTELVERRQKDEKYFYGWLKNRVSDQI